MPTHERRVASTRCARGGVVLSRANFIPTQLQILRAADETEEDLLRTAVAVSERVNLIHLCVDIGKILGDPLDGSARDMMKCCSEVLGCFRTFESKPLERSKPSFTLPAFRCLSDVNCSELACPIKTRAEHRAMHRPPPRNR